MIVPSGLRGLRRWTVMGGASTGMVMAGFGLRLVTRVRIRAANARPL